MRVFRSVLAALALACVCAAAAWAQAGYVTIKAANLTDSSGSQISNATACFAPVTSSGSPLAYRVNGAGQAISRPICAPVADGALPGSPVLGDPGVGGTNLMPDPAITSLTNWSSQGTDWTLSAGTGFAGGNSLQVASTASGQVEWEESALITVVPGQTYTFGGYIDATHAGAGLEWVVISTALTTNYAKLQAVPGTAAWYQTQFTVPSGVTQVNVLADTQGATLTGAALFSQPQLQSGASRLADTSLTFPQNVCFNFTVTSNQTGSTLIGGSGSGYQCMQPSSASTAASWCTTGSGATTCDLDNYPPATTALGVTTAPQINSVTASTLASGASATASVSGNPGAGYVISLGIPTGPQGPQGPAGTATAAGSANQVQVAGSNGELAAAPVTIYAPASSGSATPIVASGSGSFPQFEPGDATAPFNFVFGGYVGNAGTIQSLIYGQPDGSTAFVHAIEIDGGTQITNSSYVCQWNGTTATNCPPSSSGSGASTSTANTWTATQTFADGATLYPNGTATSSNNYASTAIQYQFSYWNGTAAVTDGWSSAVAVGSGATPYSALDFYGPKTLTANLSVLYGLDPSIAATSGANYNSPSLLLRGAYWTGTASSQDSWYIDDALGTGANPASTLVFSHAGSTGSDTLQFPNISVTGTAAVQNLTVTGTCTGCGTGGGGTTISDLGTLTYTAAGTTTFAAASAGIAAANVTATHSTSTTFVPTGLVKWGSYTVEIMQDATGGGVTFTLGTTGSCSAWKITGGGAGAITLSSSANAIDMLEFTYDGTNCVGSLNPNAN